jgi:very-short-patch-repair endonuclease
MNPHRSHRHNIPAARELRQRETRAEDLLWDALRGRRLDGLKFRRQHAIGPFVLDFCCVERRLAIELDGEAHIGQEARDAERGALIEAAGYRVPRFPNDAMHSQLDSVLEQIRATANDAPPLRPPAPGRDAGWT